MMVKPNNCFLQDMQKWNRDIKKRDGINFDTEGCRGCGAMEMVVDDTTKGHKDNCFGKWYTPKTEIAGPRVCGNSMAAMVELPRMLFFQKRTPLVIACSLITETEKLKSHAWAA